MTQRLCCLVVLWIAWMGSASWFQPTALGQNNSSSSSSSSHSPRKGASAAKPRLDAGSVSNGVYRNSGFGFSCKIPAGWVLRTEEMNEPTDEARSGQPGAAVPTRTPADREAEGGCSEKSCVLLAAFSRPPAARGEDVNSSILIAVESASSYPGLKEAEQYFGPVTEIAQAQGFAAAGDPYEVEVGTKALARGDFQKDVGTRLMRQSTLVMLAREYLVSFTFIGGTEDEVEELVNGLSFSAGAKAGNAKAK